MTYLLDLDPLTQSMVRLGVIVREMNDQAPPHLIHTTLSDWVVYANGRCECLQGGDGASTPYIEPYWRDIGL